MPRTDAHWSLSARRATWVAVCFLVGMVVGLAAQSAVVGLIAMAVAFAVLGVAAGRGHTPPGRRRPAR